MKTTYSLLAFAIALSCFSVQAADMKDRNGKVIDVSEDESYKSILEYEAKRISALQTKLDQHKERLKAHTQGHRMLSDAEHAKLTHQSALYTRYLKQLTEESKADKLEKIDEAKEFHQKHHMSKLDLENMGL